MIYKDKATGKWKTSPSSKDLFETRDQAKNSWLEKKTNDLRGLLSKIRTKRMQ